MRIPPIDNLPFLRSICWQGQSPSIKGFSEREILQLYERNWRFKGVISDIGEIEGKFLHRLAAKYSSWLINEDESASVNFRRDIHNIVLRILNALRADFFRSCFTYFGGGTMLVLDHGEYRLSRDIDFLCPYGDAFSRLRRAIYNQGYEALFDTAKCDEIAFPREIRTDQYGIRFEVCVSDVLLKFEIVAESRIDLSSPSQPDWSPVACLGLVDQIAEKLLANGDRWADASVLSRDLIDLAILKQKTAFPQAAMDKAEAAYPTVEPLKRSILAFQQKPDYRLRCYEQLQVKSAPLVIDGLDGLAQMLELPSFDRVGIELESPQ